MVGVVAREGLVAGFWAWRGRGTVGAASLFFFASSRVKDKVKENVIVFDGFMTGY